MSFFKKISTATVIAVTLMGGAMVTSPAVLAAVSAEQQGIANKAATIKAKQLNGLLKAGRITLEGEQGAARQLAEHIYSTLTKLRGFAATPEELASAVATASNQAGLVGLSGTLAASAAATVVPGLAVNSVISIAPTLGAAGGAVAGGFSTSYIILALAGAAGLAAVANSGGGNNNTSGG